MRRANSRRALAQRLVLIFFVRWHERNPARQRFSGRRCLAVQGDSRGRASAVKSWRAAAAKTTRLTASSLRSGRAPRRRQHRHRRRCRHQGRRDLLDRCEIRSLVVEDVVDCIQQQRLHRLSFPRRARRQCMKACVVQRQGNGDHANRIETREVAFYRRPAQGAAQHDMWRRSASGRPAHALRVILYDALCQSP